MRVELLGTVVLRDADGVEVDLGGPLRRALLARLALDAPRPVPTDVLVEALWGRQPPAGAANALQSQVSRIRRALRSAAPTSATSPASATSPGVGAGALNLLSSTAGYRLDVDPQQVDAHRFAALVAAGRDALRGSDAATAATLLTEAEALWRGPALADLAELPFAAGHAIRLEQARLDAAELRFAAFHTLGRDDEILDDLGALARDRPLREPLRALWMRALARAGRTAEALSVFTESRRALAEELGADPTAVLTSAHLDVLRGGERAAYVATSASAPAAARVCALPATVTSFVGRETELSATVSSLTHHRLVTLVGTGGAGKTRLALAAAERLASDAVAGVGAADGQVTGVVFVELAAVRGIDGVARAILEAAGHPELAWPKSSRAPTHPVPSSNDHRDAAATAARVTAALRGRSLLVVLDNCEHVIDAAAAVASDVLAGCRTVRVLATSRERLGIDGERLLPVDPLPLPPAGASWDEALGYPSVRLFADRAEAVRPGMTPDDRSAAAIVEICRRLDGLPLALELAAARLRTRSAADIAQRLDDRFRLLTGGSRTALARHQTLRAVVSWSWDLLDDAERKLLRRLSVCAGPATAAAATAIFNGLPGLGEAHAPDETGGLDPLDETDVLDLLDALVEKSLLVADRDDDGGDHDGNDHDGDRDGGGATGQGTRYRMLDTVHAFARERLVEAGTAEGTVAHEAHAAFFVTLAEQAGTRLRTFEQLVWIRRLRADHENVLAALRWVVDTGRRDEAMRLGAAMGWLWTIEGHHMTVLHWLGDVVALADDQDRRAAVPSAAATTATTATPMAVATAAAGRSQEAVRAEAVVRVLHATNYGITDDQEGRTSLFARTRPFVQGALDDPDGGFAVLFDAIDALWSQDLPRAEQLAAQVVADHRADDWTKAAAHLFAGRASLNTGRPDAARHHLAAAAALFGKVGDRWGQVQASVLLAELQALAGRTAEAISWADANAELAAELGAFDDAAAIRAQVGVQRARTGDRQGALAEIDAARRLSANHGPGIGPAVIELCLAEISLQAGDLPGAEAHFGEADRILVESGGLPELRAVVRSGLAAAAAEAGDPHRGWLLHREAAAMATTATDSQVAARVVESAAVTAAQTGEAGLAATLFGVAVGLRGTIDLGDPRVRRARRLAAGTLGEADVERRLGYGARLYQDGGTDLTSLLLTLFPGP